MLAVGSLRLFREQEQAIDGVKLQLHCVIAYRKGFVVCCVRVCVLSSRATQKYIGVEV